MSNSTVVKDFITVEGVNAKVSEKLPEYFRSTLAGSVKTASGWINVRKGLDMADFEKGGTYEVEMEISEKGNKTIIAVPSLTADGAKEVAPAAQQAKATSATYRSEGNGAEAGGIMHDAVALAAAIGVLGASVDDAVLTVETIATKLLEVKRSLQSI